MLGLPSVVDALGGVEIQLDAPMGGLPAGAHHLDGVAALAFVRERSSSDDFSRMVRTQMVLSAIFRKALQPAQWGSLPRFVFAVAQTIDTNVPLWQWPRLVFAFARGLWLGVDGHTVTREMVQPLQTSQGAQVLSPDWEAINPLLREMFGQ
jgi:anionic cell wall polymer biosynthesis LytR-Cps2A-Psr (LCP) family protein